MGIHHTYRSQRGERDLRKQLKQEELQKRSRERQKSRQTKSSEEIYEVPADEVITLDHLTNPNRK